MGPARGGQALEEQGLGWRDKRFPAAGVARGSDSHPQRDEGPLEDPTHPGSAATSRCSSVYEWSVEKSPGGAGKWRPRMLAR